MKKNKKIAFATGGTGGHVIPAKDIAESLASSCEVIYVGVGLQDNPYIQGSKGELFGVSGSSFSKGFLKAVKAHLKGVSQARKILRKEGVSLVVGMGSFHSVPVLLAALSLKIPYIVFELNVIPGRVNRLFSRWARASYAHFLQRDGNDKNVQLVNIQAKPSIQQRRQEEDRRRFGFFSSDPVVLVIGGSSGARGMDHLFLEALREKDKLQVIHTTKNVNNVKQVYEQLGIRAFVTPFLVEIDAAWNAADFAISRAGAGALRSMLIHKKPAILIPYPHAVHNHQECNAKFITEEVGGGKMLKEGETTPERLRTELFRFLDKKELEKMGDALVNYQKSFNHPTLCDVILEDL